jgi:hypothetical protein
VKLNQTFTVEPGWMGDLFVWKKQYDSQMIEYVGCKVTNGNLILQFKSKKIGTTAVNLKKISL